LLAVLVAATILVVAVALVDLELRQVLLFLSAQLTPLLLVEAVQELQMDLILFLVLLHLLVVALVSH
jgi:hypothetical protein